MSRTPSFSLFVVAAAVLLVLPGAARADLLLSPQGYSVNIPHGWQTHHELLKHSDGYVTDMVYAHPPQRFPIFRVEAEAQRSASMATAEAMQAAFIKNRMTGFQVIAQRMRTVAGSPAAETAAGGLFKGRQVLMDTIATIHGGKIYTITLITTPQTLKADNKTFENILTTVKWTAA